MVVTTGSLRRKHWERWPIPFHILVGTVLWQLPPLEVEERQLLVLRHVLQQGVPAGAIHA